MFLTILAALFISLKEVHSLRPELIYAKQGELVALHCPYITKKAEVFWTIPNSQKINLTHSESTSTDHDPNILIEGRSLIILRASQSHQGNYSCFQSNTTRSFRFRLLVDPTQSKQKEERGKFPATCYTKEPCMLYCPEVNIPQVVNSNMTSHSVTWNKKDERLPAQNYFSSVEEKDGGVYICTRSYLYDGQLYNTSFTVILDVKLSKQFGKSEILSPRQKDVFLVDLGSTLVIECTASLHSNDDIVFWLSGASFVETNNNQRVFSNESWEDQGDKIKRKTFLVFKEVSEEDLSKNFTCKLQSDRQLSSSVTITLAQKAHPVSFFMYIWIVGIVVFLIIIVATVWIKFKSNKTLFLRQFWRPWKFQDVPNVPRD